MNKKGFLFCAFIVLTFALGYVKANLGDYSTLGYDTPNGTAFWRVDSSGYFKPGTASTLDIGTAALPVRKIYTGDVTATGTISLGTTTVNGGLFLFSKTQAAIEAITGTAGQIYFCSDCTATTICVSTGTLHGWIGLESFAANCD